MGKVTKIMLSLNILAGIAGIIFGAGIKKDLKKAEGDKVVAVSDAASAKKNKDELEKAKKDLTDQIDVIKGDLVKAEADLGQKTSELAAVINGQDQKESELQTSLGERAQLQSQLAAVQILANQTQKLKSDIAAYEALGTTQEIRGRLAKLDKIEADAAAKKKKAQDAAKNKPKPNTPKPGAEVGSVASFDPKFGFAVLNRGASHGIKVGDVFRVTRNGQLVGKVTVQKADPTTAIANPIKQFTREPLKAGDKLVKDS